MSLEAVTRGLANGDLVKGSLRVNQRNYEESYVDNPDGDDQLDLLILGVHDRNRALHGDVVVVRIKERMNWVIRENLYQAWRAGHLNVSREDNGQPITIPPVAAPKPDDMVELELARREVMTTQSSTEPIIHPSLPSPEVQKIIDSLSIGRVGDFTATASSQLARKILAVPKRTPTTSTGKRSAYRTLSEMPDEDWGVPDVCLQKTAEVMYIMEMKNCRAAMGQLKVMTDGNRNWALFSPTDSRMPRMMIPADQLPPGFFERPQDFAKFIFVARMVEWQATAQFARGKLERTLGLAGDVDAETEGLLFANNVDTREFSVSVMHCLPIAESKQWTIDEKEFKYRRDLRDNITFTISARNSHELDDALSIEELSDCDGKGTPGFEVGVHIADVSHFVFDNTELDAWAANRACTVNLVHKSIPMLPRVLTEDLCSLIPGKDRLAFSVMWKMDKDGTIVDEWFGRTIIRSRVHLGYDHVQGFIEEPEKKVAEEEYPEVHDGVSLSDIREKDFAKFIFVARMVEWQATAQFARGKLERTLGLAGDVDAETEGLLFANNVDTREFSVSVMHCLPIAESKQWTIDEKEFKYRRDLRDNITFTISARNSHELDDALSIEELSDCDGKGTPGFEVGVHIADVSHFVFDNTELDAWAANRACTVNLVHKSIPMLPRVLTEDLCSLIPGKDRLAFSVMWKMDKDGTIVDEWFGRTIVRSRVHLGYDHVQGFIEEPEKKVVEEEYPEVHDGVSLSDIREKRLDMARDPIFIDGPPAQLTLFWNPPMTTIQERNNAAIEQTIQMCTVVDVVLTALPEPTKYQALIRMRPQWDTHTLLELMEKKD
ncbi:RNB-like protein [Oesophagostomum dentatum]|uniref:RNB-like protein n=1 Tax=Oesophagostomum dentatum TaxID=61180 RepID=A0A0B1T824_OESDE|nr:RNB-like protein [Oesophagostomum dentatum]